MSGHSKWSTIKHKKGAADAKRSKIFTKVTKEIIVAAKMGGGDPSSNPRLRGAMTQARSVNMPTDKVKNAIKKGTGESGDGNNYENILYEGYGPHNTAVIVECLTDNRNRTISSIRFTFNKNNGNIGSSNSVMYMFDHVGMIEVEKSQADEDTITEHVLEAGAEDIDTEQEEIYVIRTGSTDLHSVHTYLEEQGLEVKTAQLTYLPQNTVELKDLTQAKQVLKFIDALEDDDDVQNVYTNFDVAEDVLTQLENE